MKTLPFTLNTEVAQMVNVECSIVYSKLCELHVIAKSNKELKFENEYFVKVSKEAWQTIFPFFNSRKLTSIFKKLEDHGYIKKCDHFKQVVYAPIYIREKIDESLEVEVIEPWPNFDDFIKHYEKGTTIHEARSYYARIGQETREQIMEFITHYKLEIPDKSKRLDPIRFLKKKKYLDYEVINANKRSNTLFGTSAIPISKGTPADY